MTPAHARLPILPPDYFSPGIVMMHGQPVGSLWAESYFAGMAYYFTRSALGAEWVLQHARLLRAPAQLARQRAKDSHNPFPARQGGGV